MKDIKIAKQDIAKLLDKLIQSYRVLAPVKMDDYVEFKDIHAGSEAVLDYSNAKIPPKSVLFPQSERLFKFNRNVSNGTNLEEPLGGKDEKQTILFGIRPCDAKSFTLLDNVFDGKQYKDPYYSERRKATLIISFGCNTPCNACFCKMVGGGPFDQTGADILFVDIGESSIIKAVTERGEQFIKEHIESKEANKHDLLLAKQNIDRANASMGSLGDIKHLKEKMDKIFEDSIWSRVSEKCVDCGICTYLCPTCHCFDITDEFIGKDGYRVRTWDSCAFPSFTIEASGFNPRPTCKERLRQRIMHKFSYFPDSYGEIACVGCGRCVSECPVNVDIRDVTTTGINKNISKADKSQ